MCQRDVLVLKSTVVKEDGSVCARMHTSFDYWRAVVRAKTAALVALADFAGACHQQSDIHHPGQTGRAARDL